MIGAGALARAPAVDRLHARRQDEVEDRAIVVEEWVVREQAADQRVGEAVRLEAV